MIRSSALLTVVAMAMLIAGVSAANLGLIYLSIAVSILAAVTLAVGVLLRRRELFGEAGAGPRDARPGPAAETAKAMPVPARPVAGDWVAADRGGRREDGRRDGEQQGDVAARQRKAGSGTAADTGPARWPASIAAKGAPASARRGGGHPAGRGRAARTPPGREPAAGAGRARTASGQDRDREAAARGNREQAGREREEAAAGPHAETFRLPPLGERTRARAEEPGRAISGDPAGDEFWDRVSGEPTGGGSQDPARPAWPSSAGPRAMGTGSAPSDRVVPPYVDDVAGRGRQQREPERQPGEPDDDAARARATAGSAGGSAWSAWSSARTGDQDTDAGAAGRDSTDRGPARERASMQATTGAAADTETGAAGDHEAEAGVRGEDAASDAERSDDADDPGEPAGGIAEAENAAEPGSTRDAAGTSEAAATGDAGDANESDGPAGAGVGGSPLLDGEVTVVPGVARYHRRGCILIRFLSDGDLETTTRREAEAAGSVPCKACQPDKPTSAG